MPTLPSPIEIVFLDVDGTLHNDSHEISPRNIAALRKVHEAGIHVVLVSGRSVPSLLHVARDIAEIQYVIGSNGAGVYNRHEQKMLEGITPVLPSDAARRLIDHANVNDYGLCIYTQGDWIAVGDISKLGHEKELQIVPPAAYLNHGDVTQSIIDGGITKIMAVGDHDRIEFLSNDLQDLHGVHASVYVLMHGAMDMMPIGLSKAVGIDLLLSDLKIDKAHALAMGDSINDHEMLEHVGVPVAMANATEELKAYAKYIAPSNNNDGVAIALEALLFNDEASMKLLQATML